VSSLTVEPTFVDRPDDQTQARLRLVLPNASSPSPRDLTFLIDASDPMNSRPFETATTVSFHEVRILPKVSLTEGHLAISRFPSSSPASPPPPPPPTLSAHPPAPLGVF